MSSANLDFVRSIWAPWEHGDFSSAEWAHPEIESVYADGPSPGRWTGHFQEGSRDFVGAWKDFRVEPEEFRELDGERVLVLTRFSGRGKRSGLELSKMGAKGAHVFHVRDGKVINRVFYMDRERALADLGLPSEIDSPRR